MQKSPFGRSLTPKSNYYITSLILILILSIIFTNASSSSLTYMRSPPLIINLFSLPLLLHHGRAKPLTSRSGRRTAPRGLRGAAYAAPPSAKGRQAMSVCLLSISARPLHLGTIAAIGRGQSKWRWSGGRRENACTNGGEDELSHRPLVTREGSRRWPREGPQLRPGSDR